MLITNTHTNIYKQAGQFGTKENEINNFALLFINALCVCIYICVCVCVRVCVCVYLLGRQQRTRSLSIEWVE